MLVIILAAGKGTRMKSELSKVLHPAAGKPMLAYSIEAAQKLNTDKIAIVIGSGADQVKKTFESNGVIFYEQREQLGTANAVLAAEEAIASYEGNVLILSGDMPNVQTETLQAFINAVNPKYPSLVSVHTEPFGYGRVVRNGNGIKIIEEKDADAATKKIREINAGIYYAEAGELLKRLKTVSNNNAQKEYYLTDIIGEGSTAWLADNTDEFHGVNDRAQLAFISKIIWRRRADRLMAQGVTLIDPDLVYLSDETEIESDVTLYPNVYFEGRNKIASGCVIYSGVRIVDSRIGRNNIIKENTLIEESLIGDNCKIGPMAHLRPGTVLKGNNAIGNFVELKKAAIAEGSKANHLTYLGDAEVGRNTNIGCGTITCNYDGYNKFKTIIGNDVFVGSDTQLVAPVTVGDNALIASGTTVTKDIPADALTLARAPQQNIPGKGKEIKEKALLKKTMEKKK